MTIWLEDGLMNLDQSAETAFGKLVMPSESHSDDVWKFVTPSESAIIKEALETLAGDDARCDKNDEESWALLEDLTLYNNESWNDPGDFTKPVKAISMPQDVPSTSDRHLIELENQVQCLMEAHLSNQPSPTSQDAKISRFEADFKQYQSEMTNKLDIILKAFNDQMTGALPSDTIKNLNSTSLGESKPFNTLADLGSCVNLIPLSLFKKLKTWLLEETNDALGLADGTKLYPVGIVKNVEVHVGKLKLFKDFHVVDMEREPTCPLLVGKGFLATANAVINCKKAKIAVGEGLTRSIFGVRELDSGDDNVPYWTTIGKRESYKL
ncbi:MAK10-like protein [Tanacetum coccineum]